MNDNLGWAFWADAEVVASQDEEGVRLFAKDGFWCLCDQGVEPGDVESQITGVVTVAEGWLSAIADKNEVVGYFSLSQVERVEALLREQGCPDEVIGSVWQAWSWKDEALLHKAICWALSVCV